MSRRLPLIKRKVEFDEVDDGFAQETKCAAAGVVTHQCRNRFRCQPPSSGDPRRLQRGVGHRDLRIEARPRGGNRIDGHRRIGGQAVERPVGSGPVTDGREQPGIARAEVAGPAGGGIVAVSRGRRCAARQAAPGLSDRAPRAPA